MNTAETKTPDLPATTPEATATVVSGDKASDWMKVGAVGMMIVGVLGFLYVVAFHLGAAVLSYQKYQSFLWAILDFFFPYFYYPYYAFVVSKEPTPVEAVVGGMRRPRHRSRSRGFFRRI